MDNFIDHIEISNFKSIKSCKVKGCNRINLFIGKPNVGKSNILEALSLLSIPYLTENSSRKLTHLLRVENEAELFYNGNIEDNFLIITDVAVCGGTYSPKSGLEIVLTFDEEHDYEFFVDDKLYVRNLYADRTFKAPVKRYSYNSDVAYKKGHAQYLIPPFGANLLSIIENYKELKGDVINLFKEYGLDIVFDRATQTIKVLQQKNKDSIFLIPYNSIADTLQRIIFYKAAIASNSNSVLLFEEPEAHSFPPYMTHLTQEMIRKKDNQYFVATHSPFILNDLLENGRDELAVFVVHYDNYQTKVRKLTDKELHSVFQDGVDLFTNIESFF